MKKILIVIATLCLTVLFVGNASAFEVIFTNGTSHKGSSITTIGANCPDGSGNNNNSWQSPSIYEGTVVTGNLPCPVTASSWNYGEYYFKRDDGTADCDLKFPDDVDTVLKNGYTQVYVNVSDNCRITRTFNK